MSYQEIAEQSAIYAQRIMALERERVIKQTHIENLNSHIANLTAKLAELERERDRGEWKS